MASVAEEKLLTAGRVECRCRLCGGTFVRWRADTLRGRMKYCSAECRSTASRKYEPVEFGGDRFSYNKRYNHYYSHRTRRLLNRAVWESHYGEVPEGYEVWTKDGDALNYSLENLILKVKNERAHERPPLPAHLPVLPRGAKTHYRRRRRKDEHAA